MMLKLISHILPVLIYGLSLYASSCCVSYGLRIAKTHSMFDGVSIILLGVIVILGIGKTIKDEYFKKP